MEATTRITVTVQHTCDGQTSEASLNLTVDELETIIDCLNYHDDGEDHATSLGNLLDEAFTTIKRK